MADPRDTGLSLEMALDRGLAWLFSTDHPEGSTVFHLGDSLAVRHNRRLSFIPAGSADGACPVVVLEVRSPRLRKPSGEQPLGQWGLAPQEMDSLAGLLYDRGHEVTSRWNGFPSPTGSLALGRSALHPSMQRALDNYRRGCSMHGGSVFCNCAMWRQGFNRLIPLRTRSEAVAL